MFGRCSFKGGVHPPHRKEQTSDKPIETLAAPKRVIIPLSQHIGAPAKPLVKRQDRVKIGQIIGEAGGFVSAPVHSSVSGTVLAVGKFPHPLGKQVMAVEIENDGTDERTEIPAKSAAWQDAPPSELVQCIVAAGIVGMGGASFPTHVKLSPPADKPIDTLIINGAECEPYLTADHRLMLEKTDEMLTGVLIVRKALGAKRAVIAIEDNKPDAIAAVSKRTQSEFKELTVVRLRTKYPQGGEKQLIKAVAKREVPSGGLPMDVGCVVQNVGTAYAIWDAVVNGTPLYQRVVTVTGPTVASPRNLLIRIGTPVREVLSACSANLAKTAKVIMGGPMMGIALSEIDVPVIKSTSGILAYDRTTPGTQQYDCIHCGNCLKACPINLIPTTLAKLVEYGKYDDLPEWNIADCIECGSCAYVCPSKINLVHYMKIGKYHLQAKKAAAQGK